MIQQKEAVQETEKMCIIPEDFYKFKKNNSKKNMK